MIAELGLTGVLWSPRIPNTDDEFGPRGASEQKVQVSFELSQAEKGLLYARYPFTSPGQASSGMARWGRPLRALASRSVM